MINDALRRELSQPPAVPSGAHDLLCSRDATLQPGFDLAGRFNRLAEDLRTRRFLPPGNAPDRDRPRLVHPPLYAVVSALPAAQRRPARGVGTSTPPSVGHFSGHLRVHPHSDESASAVTAADGRCRHGIRIPPPASPNVTLTSSPARGMFGLPSAFCTVSGSRNLTTDVQLAAFALEHDADMLSNDTDFARFSGLRWRNPLA